MNILYELKVISVTLFGPDLMNYNSQKSSYSSKTIS